MRSGGGGVGIWRYTLRAGVDLDVQLALVRWGARQVVHGFNSGLGLYPVLHSGQDSVESGLMLLVGWQGGVPLRALWVVDDLGLLAAGARI